MQEKRNTLPLPDEVINIIASYLSPFDTLDFALWSKASFFAVENELKHKKAQHLVNLVAFGEQDKAHALLKNKEAQTLLTARSTCIDGANRTFKNCTPFEYAYWAKDKHMCLMLISHMDEQTKAEMLKRCEAIDRDGLTYTQNGEVKKSSHFDLSPLITALKYYVDNAPNWHAAYNLRALEGARMRIVKAQRDITAMVVNEYCRLDRSFDPLPTFNEETLPRSLTYFNWVFSRFEPWFPFGVSTSPDLGYEIALYRVYHSAACVIDAFYESDVVPDLAPDLAAISELDKVRTNDLAQLLDGLRPMVLEPGYGTG